MYNLTVENFFYPLRTHLEELKNNELDPRDLFLYEKVKIYPSYEFNDRSEYDMFIEFSIRAPNYKEGDIIKKRTMREIDWSDTERLSNRKLLFFSFSPNLEKIDAVAISCAKKGTIINNIIPIRLLEGNIEISKEYFMFEPVDNWNEPLFNNLLNTNEMTIPKCLIKPIVYLDFLENLIDLNDSLFCIAQLFRKKKDYVFQQKRLYYQNEDINHYCDVIIKELENQTKPNKAILNKIMNDLCSYLKNLVKKEKRVEKQFYPNSRIVKAVSNVIKKYVGFGTVNEKWPFDDFTEEDFRKKCYVDHEQYKALKYSLNHCLTLVNGAPGTGKTYLACHLIKLLIQSYYDHPIVVVTYKNVSLDGLLNNIADFLEKNQVDFIRIGGRPRTENKYILSHQLDLEIPSEIQTVKSQIIYLISMNVLMNNCLEELERKSFKDISKSIINEIDKAINIREILFDTFPFYTKNEQIIIMSFLNPKELIPSAEHYFNCWFYGNEYYEQIKKQYHIILQEQIDNVFNEMIRYMNRKYEYEELTETIENMILKHFNNDKQSFSQFVESKKANILSKDTNFLYSIIFERNNQKSYDLLYHFIFFIESINNITEDIKEAMTFNFHQLLSNENKLDSFKQYLRDMKELIIKKEKELKQKNKKQIEEYEKIIIQKLGNELSKKKLIAMTATRAAQYKASLDLSNCQFMIIEEAGELTESMAFSIIPKTIKNLVMIGDYRQLRPTVEHKLTFNPYNHHISLFEKEVLHSKSIKSNNLFTLSIQRRMHPEISSLLRKVFYNNNKDEEKLNDDKSTEKLEKPLGFPNHIQFWLHDFEETKNTKIRSHINKDEAKICAYLFMLMLCRGYKSSEITIISLYKGQKMQIERELRDLIDSYYDDEVCDINDEELNMYDAFDFENDFPDIEPIQDHNDMNKLIKLRKSMVGRFVKCLDDFQGEENEVIIISLTRSERPGFVKNENRALVTLSRARQMEFVIGNNHIFGTKNERNSLWANISSEAIRCDNVVHFNGIAACSCPIHSKNEKMFVLNKFDDFIKYRFNCCQEKCDTLASCEHECCLQCHFHSDLSQKQMDILNRRYFCYQRCEKICKEGHQCNEMCGTCMHYGCPPCSHLCKKQCHYCSEPCSLNCCHEDECKCKITAICSKCNTEFKEFHGDVEYIRNRIFCNSCFKKYCKRY